MEPEDYQETMRSMWSNAARLVEWLIFVPVFFGVLWVMVRFRVELREVFEPVVGWVIRPWSRVLGGIATDLVRWDWVRWRFALVGAAGTLAIGAIGGILQLDGQWCLRTGRFWCRSPRDLDEWLGNWANHRRDSDHSEPKLRELAAGRDGNRKSGWFADGADAKTGRKPRRKKKK